MRAALTGFTFAVLFAGVMLAGQDLPPASRTTAAGVYTTAQAARGKVIFDNNCSECHMSDLSGRSGPPLKGDDFMADWRGKPVKNLVEKVRTTMPADWRTELSESRALDVVTFLLQSNGIPSGDEELTTETAAATRVD